MDETRFWKFIESIDRSQIGEAKDDEAALEPLVKALAGESAEAIRAFEDHLARSLYRLDGKKFADAAGESGGSDDGFLYARCWVVAQGRTWYEAVVADASRMPKSLDEWFESLLFAASTAWEEKTGDEWDYQPGMSWETRSNHAAWR